MRNTCPPPGGGATNFFFLGWRTGAWGLHLRWGPPVYSPEPPRNHLRELCIKRSILNHRLVRSALKPSPCPGNVRCHACAAGLQGRCLTSGVVYQLACSLSGSTSDGRLRYDIMNIYVTQKNRRRDPPWGEHLDWGGSVGDGSITVRQL